MSQPDLTGSHTASYDRSTDIETDPNDDKTDIRPIERTQKLADQLTEVERQTTDDGSLRGDVVSVESTTTNGSISVLVDLPLETEPEVFHFTKPSVWSRHYEFVRFVESYGYSSSSIAAMIEDKVSVAVDIGDDGEYELIIPESRQSKVRRRLSTARKSIKDYTVNDLAIFAGWGISSVTLAVMMGNQSPSGPASVAGEILAESLIAVCISLILLVGAIILLGGEDQ